MSIATLPTSVALSPTLVWTARGMLLSGIRWHTYEALLEDVKDRPIRLTYDRGRLEIMAPTFNHERCKRKIGRIVETLAEEEDRPIISGGSTTFRREDLERGLEPDDCFYLNNVAAVLQKTEIDLRSDPPPDLALEIDITSSSLDRMAIYAALGIAEIWRFDGDLLEVYVLHKDGQYLRSNQSLAFPKLDLGKFEEFLRDNLGLDDGGLVKAFRAWVRPYIGK